MIKRRKYILIVFAAAVLAAGIFVILILNKGRALEVKAFDTGDYQYYIDNFSSEDDVGSITDAADAIKKAEKIWIEAYGKQVKKEKPYQVFYDENSGIWLVQGTLRANSVGGVANFLADGKTGKVLAVWHEK